MNLRAAIEDLNKAKEDIAINVTSAYLQVLFNLELSKVAFNQTNLSKDQLKRIKGLFEVGKASPSEVAEAQARVAQDEMTSVQADNTYKLSLLDLSQLLELPTPEGFILENPKEELLSGMYVKIRLPYKVVKDALLIPEASIGTGQAGRYVYLVDENNRVVQQTVKVGVLSNDGMREIVSGVTPDDRYVVEALMNVRPGMTVKPVREKTKR